MNFASRMETLRDNKGVKMENEFKRIVEQLDALEVSYEQET